MGCLTCQSLSAGIHQSRLLRTQIQWAAQKAVALVKIGCVVVVAVVVVAAAAAVIGIAAVVLVVAASVTVVAGVAILPAVPVGLAVGPVVGPAAVPVGLAVGPAVGPVAGLAAVGGGMLVVDADTRPTTRVRVAKVGNHCNVLGQPPVQLAVGTG